jgi:hypothetical protein
MILRISLAAASAAEDPRHNHQSQDMELHQPTNVMGKRRDDKAHTELAFVEALGLGGLPFGYAQRSAIWSCARMSLEPPHHLIDTITRRRVGGYR